MSASNRDQSIEWARRILDEPNVIFLDTETTGLDDDAELVDIAVIDRHGTVLLETLVRPSGMIPQDAIDLHGIPDAAVIDAPTWPEVYPLVGRLLDRYSPVVIYNSEFDVRVMNRENRRHGLPEFHADWQCAMKQYAAFAGIWHPRYESFRWHKLSDALRMVNRDAPGDAHRALADAQSCRLVVEAMAAEVAYLSPSVYRPGELTGDAASDWTARTHGVGPGQVTVVSHSSGCSTGLLLAILFVGLGCIVVGCCAFFYLMMVLS